LPCLLIETVWTVALMVAMWAGIFLGFFDKTAPGTLDDDAFATQATPVCAATKAKLDRGARIVELFKQQQYQPKSLPVMVISLYAMQNGYFDDVPVDRIRECQAKLEEFLTTRKEPLLEKLGNEKVLDNVEPEIKTAISDFKASWK